MVRNRQNTSTAGFIERGRRPPDQAYEPYGHKRRPPAYGCRYAHKRKINTVIKFIKNVWKDPVWSKVIAAGVLAIVAGTYAYSKLASVSVLIALIIWIIIQNQALYRKSQTEQLIRGELIYDVFISSPMASISGENEFQLY